MSSSSGGKTGGQSSSPKSNNKDEFINKIGQIRHMLTSPQTRSRSQTSVPRLYTKNTPESIQYFQDRQNASMCNINNNRQMLLEPSAEVSEPFTNSVAPGVVPSSETVGSFGRNELKRRPTTSYRNHNPLERRRPATTTKELEKSAEVSSPNFDRLNELFHGRRYRRHQSESSANSYSRSRLVSESINSISESANSANYLAYELSSSYNSTNSANATTVSSPKLVKNLQLGSNPRTNEQRRHSGVSLKTQKLLSKLCKSRESLTAIGKESNEEAKPKFDRQITTQTVVAKARTGIEEVSQSSSDDEEECKQRYDFIF